MDSLRKCAIAICMLLLPTAVLASGLSNGEKDTISIGVLKVDPSVTELAEEQGKLIELKRISGSLETQLISSLSATRVFQLVDRKRSGEYESAQQLTASAEDSETGSAAKAGKEAGAKFVLLPEIDGFEDTSEVVEHTAIGRSTIHRRLFLSALVQIVDTATGELLPDPASIQIAKSEEIRHERPGQPVYSDRITVELAREMAQRLTYEALALLRPAKVLSVTGRQVMLNRGSDAGFEKGDLVELYVTRKEKDDDTGEIFLNEIPVGQAIISRLDKKQSFATISGEDLGITKGTVARKLKSAASRKAEAEDQPADPTLPDFGGSEKSDQNEGSGEKPLKWK